MGNYLFGTGGLAKEIFGWMSVEKNAFFTHFEGFIEDNPGRQNNLYGHPIFSLDKIPEGSNIVVAIGDGKTRKMVFERIEKTGSHIASFVSKHCIIGHNVSLERGVIVNPRSSISSDCVIDEGVVINCDTGVGHGTVIGAFSTLLGANAVNGDCVIAPFATIGSGSVIHPGSKIGEEAVVGIGAVVIRNVKDRKVVF